MEFANQVADRATAEIAERDLSEKIFIEAIDDNLLKIVQTFWSAEIELSDGSPWTVFNEEIDDDEIIEILLKAGSAEYNIGEWQQVSDGQEDCQTVAIVTITKLPETLYATNDLGGETYAYESLGEITEEMEVFRDSFIAVNNEDFDPTNYEYKTVELAPTGGLYIDKRGQEYTWDRELKELSPQ